MLGSQRCSHGPISSAMVPPLSAARMEMPTGVAVPSALRVIDRPAGVALVDGRQEPHFCG